MIQNDSHSIPPFHFLSNRSMDFRLISLPFGNQTRPHHCLNRQVQKLGKNKYVYYIHIYIHIYTYFYYDILFKLYTYIYILHVIHTIYDIIIYMLGCDML